MSTVLDRPSPPPAGAGAGPKRPLVVAGVTLLVLAGLVGYGIGSRGDGAQRLHGTAYVGVDQVSAEVGSTFYSIPLSIPWRDIQGTWHEEGRPACLGAPGQSRPVTFGAVQFKREGLRERAVVWVDCSR